MEKLIIENRTDLPMIDVLPYVTKVIKDGRISGFGEEYCYHTEWNGISITSHKNKKSDRLIIEEKSGEKNSL